MYQGVSKKYGVENCNILTNSAIYQSNILSHDKYNFYLGLCKDSIQYIKGN